MGLLDQWKGKKLEATPLLGGATQALGLLGDAGTMAIRELDKRNKAMARPFTDTSPEAQKQAVAAAMDFVGMAPVGMTKIVPRTEAFRIAQANAAKPVSEGGLGLRPDNTPMERAQAMGFDINGYHGTVEDVKAFDPRKYGSATGAPSAQQAAFIAKDADGLLTGGAETASQYARIGDRTANQLQKDISAAERRGKWDEYEAITSKLEDYEIGKVRQAESAAERRDQLIDGLGVLRNAYKLDGVESISDFMRFYGVDGIDMYRANFKDALAKNYTGADFDSKANYFDKLVDSYRGAVVSGLDSEINSGANVMPLMVRSGNSSVKDFGGAPYRDESFNDVIGSAFKSGADTAILKNTFDPGATSGAFSSKPAMLDVVAVKNPANIRSRFAAFDPARRMESDLLGYADPRLLGGIVSGGLLGGYFYDK